jgi:pyruvate/2-oxoglutarate/acetoin dehydrogenase E1 component
MISDTVNPESLTVIDRVSDYMNRAPHDALAADECVIATGDDFADREDGGVFGVSKGHWTRFGSSRVRSAPMCPTPIEPPPAPGLASAGSIPKCQRRGSRIQPV